MAGYTPHSYSDLRASENNNSFARLWNRLLERLDQQRIVFKGGFFEENTGTFRIVGVDTTPISTEVPTWSGYVQFANLRGAPGRVPASGSATSYIKIFRDSGTVQYDDGSTLTNWQEGTEIYDISQLPPGDLIIH